jgi:hypothetical protein
LNGGKSELRQTINRVIFDVLWFCAITKKTREKLNIYCNFDAARTLVAELVLFFHVPILFSRILQ